MDEYDGELTEVEERLLKLIEAQSELLNKFISMTDRRLSELEECKDKHEDSIYELDAARKDLVGKVDHLDETKQDVPDAYELGMKDEEEKMNKEERLDFENRMTNHHDSLVTKVETIEDVITPGGESLGVALERVRESLSRLDDFVRSRIK